MKLAALIRKNALTELANAIPAIPAIEPTRIAASVARMATIAVANPTSEISAVREWRIAYPDAATMTVLFSPSATRADVADVYRGAAIEPMAEWATRTATTAEADELRELVGANLSGATDGDRAEALAVALADVDAALTSFRALAAQQNQEAEP